MDYPRVGIGVFVRRDNLILLGLRHGAHGPDTWSLPGGHLEFGESFEECAHREVEEECSITIANPHIATVTNDMFSTENKHYVTIFIICDYHGGNVQLREPDRCREWRWCTWDNIPSPLFLPLQHAVDQGFNPIKEKRNLENFLSRGERIEVRG